VRVKGETGVEMEALTAVSVAALTLYDMARLSKGHDHLGDPVDQKSGGRAAITNERKCEGPGRLGQYQRRQGRSKREVARSGWSRATASRGTPTRARGTAK
jgi:hypothetical protein